MSPDRAHGSTRDVLVCADVLGAFGVTPADVRTQTDPTLEDRSLERVLAIALEDTRDRTAMVRQIVCRSSRGLDCSARYSTSALADELTTTFEAVDWSIDVCERDGGGRLGVRATDGSGRRRETEIEYPETPLECDNFPAVLAGLNDEILYSVDARFVLLSSGVDRWRAALVEREELEGVRDRYGHRIPVFDRPLCPEYGIDSYVGGTESRGECGRTSDGDSETGPWPAWALERTKWSTSTTGSTSSGHASESDDSRDRTAPDDATPDLIEEAEPDRSQSESESGSRLEATTEAATRVETGTETGDSSGRSSRTDTDTDAETLVSDAEGSNESMGNGTTSESSDLVVAGGSPTVSRVRQQGNDERNGERGSERDGDSHQYPAATGKSERAVERTDPPRADRNDRSAVVSRRERRETDTDGFGTLSGKTKTARVTNDSFGADVETPTDDDRYRALGAAIGTGKNVSVKGLLDDDEFLPELPAAERVETRIEFADEFDPAAVPKAKAAAEESGFEWVESGSLETTRISES
ncbi:hypothetical protein [Natronoglomus mannanivorans]|uniref:Uncharacterized protein n=1 Tax=Natronoglomus mannanivorans TaxID=2979990 RepID=A0AAP2Z0T0_9EURY|nr:hypothetical protein [Halobacteria archaeon AArc-xg1-1]